MDALPLKLKMEGELSAQIYYQFMSINEELGRHRGQNDRQSLLYVVLSVRVWSMWECPDYKDSRDIFMIKLRD